MEIARSKRSFCKLLVKQWMDVLRQIIGNQQAMQLAVFPRIFGQRIFVLK